MICENCGKDHDGSYGSGRFCSSKCARSFSSKSDKNKGTKIIRCLNCDKVIEVHKHDSNNALCAECKRKSYKKHHSKTCQICGSSDCKHPFCVGHSVKFVKSTFERFGMDLTSIGSPKVFDELEKLKNLMLNLYFGSELSSVEIAEMYDCKNYIITDLFIVLGIRLRNASDAMINALKTGRMDLPKNQFLYKDEHHKTWDGRTVYLRSSYETDFANYLDSNRIKYDVESLKIQYFDSITNKYRTAIPDFYIPETNTIYEIKSSYTYIEQNMIDKFKAYKNLGYNCKLILDHQEKSLE